MQEKDPWGHQVKLSLALDISEHALLTCSYIWVRAENLSWWWCRIFSMELAMACGALMITCRGVFSQELIT